jgi:hypothetical protein
MWRRVGGGIAGLVVDAGGAESTDHAVGHGLAALNGLWVLEIENDIRLGRGVEGFGVPR